MLMGDDKARAGSPPEGPHPADASPTGHPPGSASAESAAPSSAPLSNARDGLSVGDLGEEVEEDLKVAQLAQERDEYLGALQRVQADFENYRKRIMRQQAEHLERAAEELVEKLLDVLDSFEQACAHGKGFEQVYSQLTTLLDKEGLERIDPMGEAFDPNEHDAVAHEAGDGEPAVSEVLRPGYRWKGRVLRPAMVKVRG
jgi:molecular chaperone GrpE